MTDKIVVLSTCSSAGEARRIAADLVNKRLAACVNLVSNVRSIYHWKGAVEDSEETLMIIKSARSLFERLRIELARQHSYEVPEVIALPIVDGHNGYLEWMDRELAQPEEQ